MAGKLADPSAVWSTARQNSSKFDLTSRPEKKNVEGLMKDFLLPHFKRLCQESQANVRLHVASVFHEFAQSLKHDAPLIIDSFIDLCQSGDPEVIRCLAVYLEETLECVFGEIGIKSVKAEMNGITRSIPLVHPSCSRLIRTLVACNRLVRNGSQWRSHEQLLISYACLSRFLPKEQLCHIFLPVLKEEILTARALPCRLAALRTLIKWTGELKPSSGDFQSIVHYCTNELGQNRSCHKRQLFLDSCEMSIELISKDFFKIRLFTAAMRLANDPVLNVRMKLCKLLPKFKRTLTPGSDTDKSMLIDNAIKIMLSNDNKGHMAEIVKKAINEMAHADAIDNAIRSSETRKISVPSSKEAFTTITKNSSAPLPARTLPRVLWAVSSLKDGLIAKGKPKTTDNINTAIVNGESKKPPLQRKKSMDENYFRQNSHSKLPWLSNLTESKFFDDDKTASGKKIAIVYPRRISGRSPSPHPRIRSGSSHQYEHEYDHKPNGTTVMEPPPIVSSSNAPLNGGSTMSLDSKFDHLLYGNSASVVDKENKLGSERIVPIRFVSTGDSTGQSFDWNSLRPSTPTAFRRLSFSTATLPRTSPISPSRVRNIPVVRTGAVMKSVGMFEHRPPLSK